MEAFVYMFYNFATRKRYIGWHKGDELDGYICSASEEFFKDYYSNSICKRKVLARGTSKEMQVLEHKLLTQQNAKNNPKYYNNSNGGIFKKEPQMKTDFKLVQKLKDSIPNRRIELAPTKDVFALPRLQTRALSVRSDKVNQIAEKIRVAGTIDKMSPIIIVTNTSKGNQLLDGNHTIHGAKKAKVAEVKVVFIDFAEFSSNELNLIGLGNALNHVDIVKTAPSNDDIKQTLIQAYKLGQDITDKDYKQELANVTGREIKAIIRMAASVLEGVENEGVHRVWQKDELQAQKMKHKKEGVSVVTHSSGSKMTDRAIGVILSEMYDDGNDKGILIYHHTKPKFAKEFDKRRVMGIIETTGKTIHVVELDNVPI